jgi:hypothetical protein
MVVPFTHVLADEAALREIYRQPSQLVQAKKTDVIDPVTAAFIAASPFCLVATSSAEGRSDVSPRGGPAGFLKVLDDRRIALPDLNGNNLCDSMTNIIESAHCGLLVLLPGKDETLRVNGRAWITIDPDILSLWDGELRQPKAAIGIEVDEVFIHCAKAFRRGGVWEPAAWAALSAPEAVEMLICHANLDTDVATMSAGLEAGYRAQLALDRPE